MIQFYINSRPVPRAIARNHLEQSSSLFHAEIASIMAKAVKNSPEAIKFINAHGVSVASLQA
jgi:hypothetical protein